MGLSLIVLLQNLEHEPEVLKKIRFICIWERMGHISYLKLLLLYVYRVVH